MKKLLLCGLVLFSSLSVSAATHFSGLSNTDGTVVDRIGTSGNPWSNGIIIAVDGEVQFGCREWFYDEGGGVSHGLFKVVTKSGEKDTDSIDEAKSSLLSMGGVLKLSDSGGLFVDPVSLRNNYDSSNYTIRFSSSVNGLWSDYSEYYVGSSIQGGFWAERVAQLLSKNELFDSSSLGTVSNNAWDGGSIYVELVSAEKVNLDPGDGECSLDTAWAYAKGDSIVVGTKLPNATPDNSELVFDGWYTEEEGGTKVNLGDSVSTDRLYAHYVDSVESDEFADSVEVGNIYVVNGIRYKVMSVKDSYSTVTVLGFKKTSESVSVPGSFSIDGYKFEVNSIAARAFKRCGGLKSVSIGNKVRVIGKGAFRGCSGLDQFLIKSRVLYSVGKNCFKGVPSKCVYVLPKNKKGQYVKLIRNAK